MITSFVYSLLPLAILVCKKAVDLIDQAAFASGNWKALSTQWKWIFVPTSCVLLLLITTRLATLAISTATLRKNNLREPPVLPYSVPLVGHTFSFIWDPYALFKTVINRYGISTPARVRFGALDVFIISGRESVSTIWKNTTWINSKASVLLVMHQVFKAPRRAMLAYSLDDSGINARPHAGTDVRAENRIFHVTHKVVGDLFTGAGLNPLKARYDTSLRQQISNCEIGYQWEEFPDLYSFVRNQIFRAAVESMCGPYLIDLSPTFVEDFWVFDHNILSFFKGFPRFLMPRAWNARERCLQAVRKWHQFANESQSNGSNEEEDNVDLVFGTKYMRSRQRHFTKMEHIDGDAVASADLGLIWAMNANSIPAAFWFLLEIVHDPSLLARVREELDSSVASTSTEESPKFDMFKLTSAPLMQSIWAETLRLRVAINIVRGTEYRDFKLGNWLIPKAKTIVIPSLIAHMDEKIWSTGAGDSFHPLSEFWSDRFLIWPNIPGSGPTQQNYIRKMDKPVSVANERLKEAPTFSLENLRGAFIPFGGGSNICPGRHFAKHEAIFSFALLCKTFEMELRSDGSKPDADMRHYGHGTLPPKEPIPFRIRRRQIA